MEVKVYAVRVGNRYDERYEEYLKEKLPNIEFINDDQLVLQWNKMRFFNKDSKEPIVVIDIDIKLINDYMEMINYPIEKGQFLTMDPWWSNSKIQGGFYKFYPEDTKYIYEEFMRKPDYWREYFIKNGTKPGPVNGEEDFVYKMVKDKLDIKYLPQTWYTRDANTTKELIKMNKKYPGDWLKLDQYNPDIKFVHHNSTGNPSIL
jgi:hypothetical protein